MDKFLIVVLGLLTTFFVGLVLFVSFEGVFGAYIPWFQNAQTNVLHQTNQYQLSQSSGLMTLDQAYRRLRVKIQEAQDPNLKKALEAQRKAIFFQMKQQAATLSPSQIPLPVAEDINQ